MPAKVMSAKYAGKCGACMVDFQVGTPINYAGKGRVSHVDCELPQTTRYAPRRHAWDGGNDFKRVNGRCEDAPCCGCC